MVRALIYVSVPRFKILVISDFKTIKRADMYQDMQLQDRGFKGYTQCTWKP
jgi:hypothetical protein